MFLSYFPSSCPLCFGIPLYQRMHCALNSHMVSIAAQDAYVPFTLLSQKVLSFLSIPNDTFHLVFLMSHCTFIQISVLLLRMLFQIQGEEFDLTWHNEWELRSRAEVRKWQGKTYRNGNASRRHP